MNERLCVTEKLGMVLHTECRRKASRSSIELDGSVLYGRPNLISGVNTFLLQNNNKVSIRFDAIVVGHGHTIHIIESAAEFRTAMKLFCKSGTTVEVMRPDGSVFRYHYHRENEDGLNL